LTALCVGAGGQIARVEAASLALVSQSRPRPARPAASAALQGDERAAWQRLVTELGGRERDSTDR
jgi:hypothetical protein